MKEISEDVIVDLADQDRKPVVVNAAGGSHVTVNVSVKKLHLSAVARPNGTGSYQMGGVMNARRKRIVVLATAVVILMLIYPPYYTPPTKSFGIGRAGYEVLFSLHEDQHIRFGVLSLQIASVLVTGCLLLWISPGIAKRKEE